MCYVTLESVLIEESRGPKHTRLGLSKALHPSSIHCCHLQDPFMYPCVLPFRPVRSSVSSAMGFTLYITFTVSYCLLGECESLKFDNA